MPSFRGKSTKELLLRALLAYSCIHLFVLAVYMMSDKSSSPDGRHRRRMRAATESNSAEVTSGKRRRQDPSVDEDIDAPFLRRECFVARNTTALWRNYSSRPFINLGFPKMGTSSLDEYFNCGNLTSTHFTCGTGAKLYGCARCMTQSVRAGLPPLSKCGTADAYTQMDNGTFFPQVEFLEEIVSGHPDATFVLTFRSMMNWYRSLQNWPPNPKFQRMSNRLRWLDIAGFPRGKGANLREFAEWYCSHVMRVRRFVEEYARNELVEINIEEHNAGQFMEGVFGIDRQCWQRVNANPTNTR